MISSQQCLSRLGVPQPENESKYMVIWPVPADIQSAFAHVRFSAMGTIGFPKKIYCNKLIKAPLEKALRNMMERGLAGHMKTWDGCFIVRNMRGGKSYSLHSWGMAIDRDASTNRLGIPPILKPEDVKCWTDAGWEWGGAWVGRPDGMHMQLAAWPD